MFEPINPKCPAEAKLINVVGRALIKMSILLVFM